MPLDSTQNVQPPPAPARAADFIEAMSALASGVVLVTNWIDGRPWGMTVSAFASVSTDPPTVLVSLRSDTACARAIEEAAGFGVSILGRNHLNAARHGATRDASKFLERFADRQGHDLSPSVADALAHLDCEVVEQVDVADHTIFVGRVRGVRMADGEPLVYFRRAYRTLALSPNRTTDRRTAWRSS